MANLQFKTPVVDSVPKVNHEVAVGEDMEFQRRWWAFEKLVWIFFGIILLLTLLGAFGRGWLAHTCVKSPDGGLDLKYDRIQRTGTPSDLTVAFGANAIHNGEIQLFVSESLINKLGALRISPQPVKSTLGDGGVTYTFAANGRPATAVFALLPSGPGAFVFRVALPEAGSSIQSKVVVVP